jgi:hypothetical protein
MEKTFENFHWESYKNKYIDLKHIKTKQEAWLHWENHGKNENREYFFEEDHIVKLKEEFHELQYKKENFDWLKYIGDNKDLSGFLDKNQAWHHWILHGRRENRPLDLIQNVVLNNTTIHNGRFGNLFFVNMVLHFISKNHNLTTTYKYHEKFENLGIDLFIGSCTYEEHIYLTEVNYFELIHKKNNFTNIIVTNHSWFQNYEFCLYLEIYFKKQNVKQKIIKKNKFIDRYGNNNDIFIHVRLDDVENMDSHNSFEYYDNVIQKYSFDNGYIASDNLNSSICRELIQKYSLKVIDFNEEETIMFGSTCNTLILSGGTFSWLIGFLAFYAKNISYPIQSKKWYGDIFVYKHWTGN